MSAPINDTLQKWTTDKQYEFSGSDQKEKGSVMEIVLNGTIYTTRIDPITGQWSWKPPVALEDGQYSLSFRVIDKAMNVGAPTLVILNVDTTAPNKPEILRVVDDEGNQQGWLSPNAQTDDKTPTFSGSAEAGSIVRLYDGLIEVGSAVADSNGRWEITPQSELENGEHIFTLISTDKMGHESAESDIFSLFVGADGTSPVPDVAVISYATDNAGNVQGQLKNGALTDDLTPELHGTAPAGSDVRIQYRNIAGEWIDAGNATVNGTEWSWTPNPSLSEGQWEFRANSGSGWTDEFKLNISSTPSSQLQIINAWDDYGVNTGILENGAITDDRSPTLNGKAEANSIIYLHFSNDSGVWELMGSVQVGEDGRWQYETDRIAPGNYHFSASNSSKSHNNDSDFTLTIISETSSAPQITGAYDNSGKTTGNLKNGAITDDSTPEIKGKAEANSLVNIEYRAADGSWQTGYSAKTDSAGNWSFTPQHNLANGSWEFIAKTQSESFSSSPFHLIIQPDFAKTTYTENFSSFAAEEISGSTIAISGAKINFNGDKSRINDDLNSRHLHLGTLNNTTTASMIVEFEYLADKFSFDGYGVEYKNTPAIIKIYDQYNNLIATENFTSPTWAKYTYTPPPGKLVSKVDISIKNEVMGIDIDNFSYTAAGPKNSQFGIDSTQDVLGDTYGESTIVIDEQEPVIQLTEKTINLNAKEILLKGEESIFIDDQNVQFMVNGTSSDCVKLVDILPEGEALAGWEQQTGTVTIAGIQYNVFTHGEAELLIQEGVKTELL